MTPPVEPFDVLTVPLRAGVTLVEASAGTGKTFAITRLVLRLLLEQRVQSLPQILVVTFTDKATQELVTRIRRVLRLADGVFSDTPPVRDAENADLFVLRERHGRDGAGIIRAALSALDDLGVSTIHGFCQRMLAESALETGLPFRMNFVENETEPLIRTAMDWARGRLLTDAAAAELVVESGQGVGKMVSSLVVPYRRREGTALEFDPYQPAQVLASDFIKTVDRAFTREKARRHLMGFDDLLQVLSTVLTREGPAGPLAARIRDRYGAALIDEFQDTDNTQFPIFSNAFSGCPLFLIGDPKQSIYRFRGADIHAYLQAADAAEHRYTLTQNFRSSADYVRAVALLFSRAPDPFRYPETRIGFPTVTAATSPIAPGGLATDGLGAMVWWWIAPQSTAKGTKPQSKDAATSIVIENVVQEIHRLRSEGLPCRSIAVLMRTNIETASMKWALDQAGIPAVISGADDVLASEEADEIVRLANAVAAPSDRQAIASAMATRLWGSTASEIASVVSETGDISLGTITDRLTEVRELWRHRGIPAALGDLLVERNTVERLLALADGERRLTNVRHVVELLHEAAAIEAVSVDGVGAWIAAERQVTSTPARRELHLESDTEAVQVLTIHKAKGLQFDVVFCPTLWNARGASKAGPLGMTPAAGLSERGTPVLDLGTSRSAERIAQATEEEAAESQRLAYVALTRAVHRCYIAHGDIGVHPGNASNSPLGYLLRSEADAVSRATLETLVDSSGGCMSLRDAGDDAPLAPVAVGAPTAVEESVAPVLTLSVSQLSTWRMTSFTGLVADAHTDAARDISDAPVPSMSEQVASGFRAFPAGTVAGIALHEIFEHQNFARTDDAALRGRVTRVLDRFGFLPDASASSRIDDVLGMVAAVTQARIPGTSFALSDVPRDATLREWRFDLSVAQTSVRAVAAALAVHGSPHAQQYAPILRALPDATVAGYLTGVVDLLFERDGRWWIADWKSNQLGANDAAYSPEALGPVMMQAHYTLQYHLYALALHRYLRTRLPEYDPALHIGGAVYVFLRGVSDGSENGWFVDVPTPALLAALDAALGVRS